MYGQNLNYWYSARRKSDGVVDYVICADSLCHARKTLGSMSKHYEIWQLDWHHLCRLTGCILPVTAAPNERAKGNLMFNSYGRIVMLRFANRQGG